MAKVKNINVQEVTPKWRLEIEDALVEDGYRCYGDRIKQYKHNTSREINVHCDANHEPYWVKLSNFKSGRRCKECMKERFSQEKTLSYSKVKEYINQHGYKLLAKEYTGAHEHMGIECPRGHKYTATWSMFRHNENRCPQCKSSRGENMIRYILDAHNVKYKEQYRVTHEGTNHIFDFYLTEVDKYIEHQGEQHFLLPKSIQWVGREKIEKQIETDNLKREYCNEALLETTYEDTPYAIQEKVERFLELIPKTIQLGKAKHYIEEIDLAELIRFYQWNTAKETSLKFGVSVSQISRYVRGLDIKIKPVKQLKDGRLVAIYDTQKEVRDRLGYQINSALQGRTKQANGFEWQYVTQEEYERYQRKEKEEEK